MVTAVAASPVIALMATTVMPTHQLPRLALAGKRNSTNWWFPVLAPYHECRTGTTRRTGIALAPDGDLTIVGGHRGDRDIRSIRRTANRDVVEVRQCSHADLLCLLGGQPVHDEQVLS
jgi:hypothetical protein